MSGSPDPVELEAARKRQVRVMPIIVNPDFHQPTVHALLSSAEARGRSRSAYPSTAAGFTR